MERFWSFFIHKRSFSFLVLGALVFLGLTSISTIPRESSPEVQVPIGIVTTVFPGASAFDVERLVTNKIEDQLNNLEGLNKLTSSSREGVSSIVVEFDASADIDESIQKTKDEVDKVKPDLPADGDEPFVSEVNFVDQPIMLVSVATDLAIPEFIKLTEDLEREIKGISGVSRVETSGIPDREVQVIVREESLAQFGLSINDVVQGIGGSNISLPIGSIEIDGIDYSLKFEGDIEDTSDIENTALFSLSGEPVYVRDIAFVSDGVSDSSTFSRVSVDGTPSQQGATLSVFKRRGGDVTVINRAIRDKLDQLEEGLLADATVLVSFDTGELVEDDLRTLSLSGLQTVLLVMIILLIMLGWREAVIAGIAIPLSFLIAFIGLNGSGNTINFVSLFSLILAIGILVDSAIVVTEAIHSKLEEGLSKKDAALATIKEFHWPLLSGTATTIAVFAPLFFLSGVTGQFIKTIPFTIVFVLTASLFVALALVTLVASNFLKAERPDSALQRKREHLTEKLQGWYRKKLEGIIDNKREQRIVYAFLTVAFIAAFALPITGAVQVIFFPQEDIDFIYAEIEMPQGTVLAETDFAVREVEEILLGVPEIESFVTTVGRASEFGSGTSDEKFGSMTINLRSDRKRNSTAVVEDIRERVAPITRSIVRVGQPSSGPPVGDPVVIKLLGNDLDSIEVAVSTVEDVLKEVPGAIDINTSTKNDSTEFVFTIDRAKAAEVGVSPFVVAQTLRTAIFGTDATTINRLTNDIDVVVSLNLNPDFNTPFETNQTNVDAIRQLQISSPNGPVLLGSLVDVSIGKSSAVIRHEDRKRLGNVSAQLAEGFTVRDVLVEFGNQIEDVELPDGVEVSIGGETEESDESFREMGIALVMGIVLMVAVLVLQFNSFRQAFIIISVIPLALIGVLFGLAIVGKSLSFPSMLGFVALSGIVVNNSIILIDVMNSLREANNKTLRDVVIEGASSRLRPILLTTATTIFGMAPLTYASELWAPLAWAIMFGLAFATVLTLLLVPVMYYRRYSKKKA